MVEHDRWLWVRQHKHLTLMSKRGVGRKSGCRKLEDGT